MIKRTLLSAALLVGSASAGEKRIALSFDDAPMGGGPIYSGSDRTPALIDALAEAETGPVAMFITTRGFNARADGRARVEAYDNAGHLIANHSHTHPWSSQTEEDAFLADLDQASALIADFENLRPWYRFPFLDEGGRGRNVGKRDAYRAALNARGLSNGYVTVDTYDWHLVSVWSRAVRDGKSVNLDAVRDVYVAMVVDAAEHYAAMAEETLGRQPAHVLLLHENDAAAAFIGDAVSALRAAGWEIISPDEAYADPIAEQEPQTTFSGMGRIAALAYDGGARGEAFYEHWSASEEGIEERLQAAGAFAD